MNQNNYQNVIMPSTSSFVDYTDYTSTSVGNYNNILQIVTKSTLIIAEPNPNIDTIHAVVEARDHGNLKPYKNLSDLFEDLEK